MYLTKYLGTVSVVYTDIDKLICTFSIEEEAAMQPRIKVRGQEGKFSTSLWPIDQADSSDRGPCP